MRFVDNWKEAYKWLSVHVAAVMATLNALQATVPQIQAFLTPTQVAYINAGLGILVIWVRLIQQSK